MSLQVNFKTEENSQRLFYDFIELTGIYGAGNPGGYNSPNPTAVSQNFTRIKMQKRGDATVYDITPNAGLPSDVDTFKLKVYATSFGFAAGVKYDDTIYHIWYEVGTQVLPADPVITSTEDFYVIFTAGIRCCLTNIRKNLQVPSSGACHCEDAAITENTDMMNLMNGLCELVKCDKLDKAQENLEFIQRYCACHCSDCN